MPKKKILHIVESFGGGVFTFLVDLIDGTSKDFDIIVAYSERKQTPTNFKEYFPNNIKFIKVENFTRNISLIKDLKAFFEIKKIIKKENPDIVHLHSSKAGFIGRFAGNGRKLKMLYNPHGFSFLMQNNSKLKRVLYWIIEKIGSLRKCKIIGCSKGEYEEALKLTKNSICINNAINITKLENYINNFSKHIIDFNNLKVCTSGRIGYQKNPKLFNKIATTLPNIKFTWIGDGELRKQLTSKNIEVTGWKNREEVLKIVNDNDIFLLTSLWEGLPISLLEAMYLKKVCIVTDCIGNRDVVKNKFNGFVISQDNYESIIKNLNLNTYKTITENAKEDIKKFFSVKKMIEEYRSIYCNEKNNYN